jgi:hypothetical protein
MSAPTTAQWLRRATERVSVGSRRLIARTVGRALRAVGGRVSRWPWWVQIGLAYVALLRGPQLLAGIGDRVHEKVESGAWSGFLTVSAVLWIVAAYRVGGRPEPESAVEQAEDQEPEAEAQPVAPSSGPPSVSPVALIAAVRDIGTPHAQLKPLATHLGTTTDQVRAVAAGMAWAVKDVRMQGRSASAGLRWDECPSPDEVHPSPGVVGAGQPADDNDDDTPGDEPREGLRVVRTDAGQTMFDLAEAHRIRGIVGK